MAFIHAARTVLSVPWAFELYQRLVGAPECHRRFVECYVRPGATDRVVDLGCGTGVTLDHLPRGVSYVGVDISQEYIDFARARLGTRGTFVCSDVVHAELSAFAPFDVAVSFGVLHHLDNPSAAAMIELATRVVRPGGYVVTLDPCYAEGQSRIAKFLIDHDRGRHVRDADEYRRLFERYGQVETIVASDMLSIPYTMITARLRVA